MSIGTLSRKALRRILADVLLETLSGAQQVAHIRLDAVPQGVEDRGFALEGFRSRDDISRKRRGTSILKRHVVTIKYAKRLGTAHDIEDDRAVAEDDVDGIERAIRDSSAPSTVEYSCDSFDSDETVDPTGEWLIVTITAEILCQFKLRGPDEAPEAQQ